MGSARKSSGEYKLTRTEAVRQRLEEEILSGVHAAGTRLDEAEQSERLGCSRTPLREAFNQLVAVGLLVRRNHCGVFVAPRDIDGIGALTEAWAEIEALCAGLAARRMATSELRGFERLIGDPAALRQAVRQGCGNRVLADLAQSLSTRLGQCRPKGEPIIEWDETIAGGLARAMAAGDAESAMRTVRDGLLAAAPALRPGSVSAAA